ncbi:MAG TPA: hypothetical protein VKS82_05400 [Streptosporangiaceae bacterium]|nr:hypothetical protein [Streptosporangiaceae bacterium]
MTALASPAPVRVFLDWRHGQIGPLAPCVLCGQPALCRSPVKDVPCHKRCAESWITTHARDAADRARLVRAYTPGLTLKRQRGGWPA